MATSGKSARYSIAAVSKLTGISCHSLRIWERRYHFPIPDRSGSGHRRYTFEQVELLRAVSRLTQSGRSIGEIVEDAREGKLAPSEAVSPDPDAKVGCEVGELVDRLVAADPAGADAYFERSPFRDDPARLVSRVIEPALIELGERWFRRECAVFHEHYASEFLRAKLKGAIATIGRDPGSPSRTLLLGTVEGERHSGGTLLVHARMASAGWRVLNLGVDLPVREYIKAIQVWRPDAVGLSFVLSRNINKRFHELASIQGVPIFVGGRSILNYQSLARRHGLIPVPGPICSAISHLEQEFQKWTHARAENADGG
jgi:DNA-binding transcriptional MerR regulator